MFSAGELCNYRLAPANGKMYVDPMRNIITYDYYCEENSCRMTNLWARVSSAIVNKEMDQKTS